MRFINADDYELISTLASTIGQLNLYAYCNDNPIMNTDPTGTSWSSFWNKVANFFKIPFATFESKIYYKKVVGFDNTWWGRLYYSITTTNTNDKKRGLFYVYYNLYDTDTEDYWAAGVGLNLWNWLGIDLSVDTRICASVGINITPYIHLKVTLGFNGITLTGGFNYQGT